MMWQNIWVECSRASGGTASGSAMKRGFTGSYYIDANNCQSDLFILFLMYPKFPSFHFHTKVDLCPSCNYRFLGRN